MRASGMRPLQADRAWIAAHIPHQGSMCLLDGVLEHDAGFVRCIASSHRSPGNPLRSHGRLAAVCAIEYAAQAMAVHGALQDSAGGKPSPGYLASVRNAALHVGRLDDIGADLIVDATRLTGDSATLLYEFALRADGRLLAEGRAAIVLNAGAPTPDRSTRDFT
jgi:predicted hotdog family 3-hydroxylacyl-ACP dehydratase